MQNGNTFNWPIDSPVVDDILTVSAFGGSVATLEWSAVNTNYSRTLVAATTYTILATDDIIAVTHTPTAPVTVSLPEISTLGTSGNLKKYIIKDEGGNATANNITIDIGGSDTIDGASSQVINANYNSLSIYSDGGTAWFIS